MINKKELDVIIFALSRFDGPYSSISISMAKEFSKTNRVFYINHPYSIKDIITFFKSRGFKKKLPAILFGKNNNIPIKIKDKTLFMVTPLLTLPINFLPKGGVYDFFHKINDKLFFLSFRRMMKKNNIRDFIFINTYDPFFAQKFPVDIKPYFKIYQCVDDIEEVEYTKKHGLRLEKRIMENYDLTLTTSQELKRIKSKYARFIYCLPNAVDPDLFNRTFFEQLEIPIELIGVQKKVIGYIGNIEHRIDYKLVKMIAKAHYDKLLYFIGPLSTKEYQEEGLDRFKNIIFTNGKKIEELPAYLQNIDCAIIPFRCNKLTKSIYPLKINEYLAGGKPVVTTNFSEDIRLFKKVVYIAENHEQFVDLINIAINEDNSELAKNRIRVANENSWQARVEQFWEIVNSFKRNN